MTFTLTQLQAIRNKKGIYALFDGDNLVYIGQSSNMYIRILEHCFDGIKNFDSFRAVCIDADTSRQVAEVFIIDALTPKYNKLVNEFKSWYRSLPSVCHEEMKKENLFMSHGVDGVCMAIIKMIEDCNKNSIYGDEI